MKKTMIVLLALALALPAAAQNFRSRQKAQERTIRAAYKRGRVTAREYEKLMREQQIIRETIDKAHFDGILTPKEKNHIHDKLERAERRIRRYRTNNEVY